MVRQTSSPPFSHIRYCFLIFLVAVAFLCHHSSHQKRCYCMQRNVSVCCIFSLRNVRFLVPIVFGVLGREVGVSPNIPVLSRVQVWEISNPLKILIRIGEKSAILKPYKTCTRVGFAGRVKPFEADCIRVAEQENCDSDYPSEHPLPLC